MEGNKVKRSTLLPTSFFFQFFNHMGIPAQFKKIVLGSLLVTTNLAGMDKNTVLYWS